MARTVRIREARESELDGIAALMRAAYAQYMPAPDADITDETRAVFAEYWDEVADVRSRLGESQLLVAVDDDDRLLGAVTFYPPAAGPRAGSQGAGDGWAEIRLLAVDPIARGLGVGRALTEECIRRARAVGAPAIGLHTTEMMAVARAMYVRMGFVREPAYDFFPTPEILAESYRLDLA